MSKLAKQEVARVVCLDAKTRELAGVFPRYMGERLQEFYGRCHVDLAAKGWVYDREEKSILGPCELIWYVQRIKGRGFSWNSLMELLKGLWKMKSAGGAWKSHHLKDDKVVARIVEQLVTTRNVEDPDSDDYSCASSLEPSEVVELDDLAGVHPAKLAREFRPMAGETQRDFYLRVEMAIYRNGRIIVFRSGERGKITWILGFPYDGEAG